MIWKNYYRQWRPLPEVHTRLGNGSRGLSGHTQHRILENIAPYEEHIMAREWKPNEREALEAAIGLQYRAFAWSMAAMKHVGVN